MVLSRDILTSFQYGIYLEEKLKQGKITEVEFIARLQETGVSKNQITRSGADARKIASQPADGSFEITS